MQQQYLVFCKKCIGEVANSREPRAAPETMQ